MAVLTGNYPSDWITGDMLEAGGTGRFTVLIDTLDNRLVEHADVVIPSATWVEKAGTFENVKERLQAFDRAIDPIDYTKSEAQIALDLIAERAGGSPQVYNPADTRRMMAEAHGLTMFLTDVHVSAGVEQAESDMELVEL
jgi:predicted molibdopterin-dependent oxidoreductase YjgC